MAFDTQWDFPKLNESLTEDVEDVKKHALVLYSIANSKELIKRKYDLLRSGISELALVAAQSGIAPLPGLSFAVDVAFVTLGVQQYLSQFRCDKEALSDLEGRLSPEHQAELDAILAAHTLPRLGSLTDIAKFLTAQLAKYAIAHAAGQVAKFIPGVGTVVACAIGFETTRRTLNKVLETISGAAEDLLKLRARASRRQLKF